MRSYLAWSLTAGPLDHRSANTGDYSETSRPGEPQSGVAPTSRNVQVAGVDNAGSRPEAPIRPCCGSQSEFVGPQRGFAGNCADLRQTIQSADVCSGKRSGTGDSLLVATVVAFFGNNAMSGRYRELERPLPLRAMLKARVFLSVGLLVQVFGGTLPESPRPSANRVDLTIDSGSSTDSAECDIPVGETKHPTKTEGPRGFSCTSSMAWDIPQPPGRWFFRAQQES